MIILTDLYFDLLLVVSAPIIIYCKSGRRADKAKQILEEKGYETVLNAGGYDDLLSMDL
jgi:phage shock protein E